MVTPYTWIVIDGEHECTWGDFLRANAETFQYEREWVEEISSTLLRGETYIEPAGGSAGWTVALSNNQRT